jgi:hypothetical protein
MRKIVSLIMAGLVGISLMIVIVGHRRLIGQKGQIQVFKVGGPPQHRLIKHQEGLGIEIPGNIQDDSPRGASWGGIQVWVLGNQVTVTGKAEVHDTIHNHKYVWTMRVYDGKIRNPNGKEPIREKHYVDHVKIFRDGETDSVEEFGDVIDDLPAGEYKVGLYFSGVPHNFNMGVLKKGEDIRGRHHNSVGAYSRTFKVGG